MVIMVGYVFSRFVTSKFLFLQKESESEIEFCFEISHCALFIIYYKWCDIQLDLNY